MPTVGETFKFLDEHGSSLFGQVGSMLYVGHRSDTHPWWHNTFAPSIGASRLAVIDIDSGNLQSAQHITSELYLGDVRQTDCPTGFGLVFWDEGPEHLPRDVSLELCRHLAEHNAHVLISCPWGFQKQGNDPRSHEFHHWGPQPSDFEGIGWTARTFGTMFTHDGGEGTSRGHGNLIAWI